MTEYLIKRFLLEKAYETGVSIPTFGELHYEDIMFEKFKKGEIQINELEFEIWLENLKRNKRSFGVYLKSIGYLRNDMNFTEVSDDEQVTSINNICLRGDKNILLSQTGEGCYAKPYKKSIKGYLIINGVYDNQLLYLSNLFKSDDNSFTIGYYGQSDSKYTKRVIEYYKSLRKFLPLMMGQERIDVIEDTIFNGDKIYVLSHNTSWQIDEPAFVKTRHSER